MDELLLLTLTSPPLLIKQTGSFLQILIDELSPQHRWTSSYYLTLASPLLHFRQTGSSPQFSSTSSPLNTDGRALTIYVDEPFTAHQTDGLLPTTLIDELSPQHRWTSSYYHQLTKLLFTLTSPPLLIKQTGSSPQFSLTSSSLNTNG